MTLVLSGTSRKHVKHSQVAGRILFKNRTPSRAARFPDAGRSLHTLALELSTDNSDILAH